MTAKKKDHTLFRKNFARTLQLIGKRGQTKPMLHGAPESIVILARECYGDCILLTPLIGSLRIEYPELSIYIIAFSRIIFNFFSADPNVTEVYHAKRNMKRYYKGILSKKFDLLFNPKDHPSTHFLIHSLLIRARHKIGHYNPNHEGLFDQLITLEPNTHESVKNLSLLSAIGSTTVGQCRPYLPPMPVCTETASFLKTLQPGTSIGINISAGHIGGHRTLEQWSQLIKSFTDETFIILSAPKELEEKRKLEQPHSNVLRSPSTQNIYEVGEIVKKLKILITPDTSLVHIAACSDTPIIALYRKYLADRTQFGPLSTIQDIIISPTPDIIDIDPHQVTAALHHMLEVLSSEARN
ncbi:MAG: glycosyltransferase family 9 protein [Chlorobiaceae bacterium]|nr:glycosyltransferase family 9 protein [Chlorobiaceae bacterium]